MTQKELKEVITFIGAAKSAISDMIGYMRDYDCNSLKSTVDNLTQATNNMYKVINKTKK